MRTQGRLDAPHQLAQISNLEPQRTGAGGSLSYSRLHTIHFGPPRTTQNQDHTKAVHPHIISNLKPRRVGVGGSHRDSSQASAPGAYTIKDLGFRVSGF